MEYTKWYRPEGSRSVYDSKGHEIAIVDTAENAEFIAAAPELYEALRELSHKYRVAMEMLKFTDSHIENYLHQASKALAKAEGKKWMN